MHITGMKIGGIPPFTDQVNFEFDKRVNVFIGPNASGKSTLLSEINLAFNRHLWNEAIGHRWREGTSPPSLWDYADLPQDSEYLRDESINYISIRLDSVGEHWNQPRPELPCVYLGPVRIGLSVDAIGERIHPGAPSAKELLDLGFSGENLRKVYEKSRIETDHMFDQERELRESGAENIDYRASKFFSVDDLAYSCSQAICREIITRNRSRNYVTGLDIENLEHQPLANLEQVSIRRSLGVSTIDVPNFKNIKPEHRPVHSGDVGTEPLDASFLSSGTQLTLLWIWWLALEMLHHYEFMDDWHKQPAILLIDEIENHLHPTWQRRVIPALLDHFPGLQIFATTHSPFVVAGLKAGQVHLLNRDENGVVTASANTENIEGWTADEILRVYMGVHEPTDELTAQAARELRRLRDQPPVTDERGEEERQAEIRRLRQIVDRAELSGPRAAEDARFLADLRSILHRYSQSQNLNQENG